MTLREKVEPYILLAKNIGFKRGVPAELILAVILQESGGRVNVTRYEEHYKYTFMPFHYAEMLKYSMATELIHQKTSWGLMQLMLAVARELGFDDHAPALCVPATNIDFGASLLSRLLDKYASVDATLAAYNAGSAKKNEFGKFVNQSYVDSAMGYFAEIRTWKI